MIERKHMVENHLLPGVLLIWSFLLLAVTAQADPILLVYLPLAQDANDQWINNFSTTSTNVGFSSGAASFNGTNSYIIVNDPSGKLNFDFNSNSYSITFAIKFVSLTNQEMYVDRSSTQNQSTSAEIALQNGKFTLQTWDGFYGGHLTSTTSPVVGVLYRLSAVVDSGTAYLYVNGVLETKGSWYVRSTKNTEVGRTIGRGAGSSYGSYTAAQISDFRIYGGVLSNGLPTSIIASNTSSQSYTYDLNGRFTAITYSNGAAVNYSYDTAANVISAAANSPTVDTACPVITIKEPVDGCYTDSRLINVTGMASDDNSLGWISYQLNDSPWFIATTANDWSNWTATVLLNAGVNTIRAFAVDNAGNISTTNTITVNYSPSSPPAIQAGQGFGISSNGFGFNMVGTNLTVVVEACTNLASPQWVPIQTNTISSGSVYFGDPSWTNYPGRFYRLRTQ